MSDVYSITGKFDVSQIVSGFAKAEAAAKRFEASLAGHNKAIRRQESAVNRHAATFTSYIGLGHELRGIWSGAFHGLREYTDEYMRLAKAQAKFKAKNLTEGENVEAFAAVKKTVAEIKGLRLDETTESIADLHTAFGDLHHAIEMLPMASKFRFAFDTLFGDKFNPQQLEEQIQNAMKFLEVTGSVAKGQAEMERRFNIMAQITAATAGRVTPADLLQAARRAGPSAQGLSDAGLRNVASLVPELGGEGTGTALMSMYQALVGGMMRQESKEEFARLGLVDPKKIQYGKAQKIKKLLPDANKLGKLMQEDPLKAADALMAAMKKPLRGKAIDTSNMDEVRKELTILFQNRTAQKMMSILTTQRSQVVKESGLAAISKDIEELYKQALDEPMGKMKQFENAWANLQAEIGGPLVNSLTELATAAMPLVQFLGEHPKMSLWILLLLKLGSAAAQTGAALKMSGISQWFSSLFGGGGGITPAIATGATGALTKAQAEAMLFGSGTSATAVGSGIGVAIGGGIIAGLALTAIGMAVGAVMEDADAKEAAAAAGEKLGKLFAARFKAELKGSDALKEFDRQAAPEIAKNILDSLNVGRMSNDFVSGMFGAKGVPFGELQSNLQKYAVSGSGENADPEKEAYANRVKSMLYASGISGPEVLGEFLKQAAERLKAAGREDLYGPLQQLASQTFPYLEQTTANLAQQKEAEARQAETAVQMLQNLSTAAQSAAWKLNLFNPGIVPSSGGATTTGGGKETGKLKGLTREWFNPYPSKASGGTVLRDGLAKIHKGEDIVPAHVTNRLRDEQMYAGRAGSSGVSIGSMSFPITVQGNAAPGIEALIGREIRRVLEDELEGRMCELSINRDMAKPF